MGPGTETRPTQRRRTALRPPPTPPATRRATRITEHDRPFCDKTLDFAAYQADNDETKSLGTGNTLRPLSGLWWRASARHPFPGNSVSVNRGSYDCYRSCHPLRGCRRRGDAGAGLSAEQQGRTCVALDLHLPQRQRPGRRGNLLQRRIAEKVLRLHFPSGTRRELTAPHSTTPAFTNAGCAGLLRPTGCSRDTPCRVGTSPRMARSPACFDPATTAPK